MEKPVWDGAFKLWPGHTSTTKITVLLCGVIEHTCSSSTVLTGWTDAGGPVLIVLFEWPGNVHIFSTKNIMHDKATDTQASTTSKVSSFYIENLLGSRKNGESTYFNRQVNNNNNNNNSQYSSRTAEESMERNEMVYPSRVLAGHPSQVAGQEAACSGLGAEGSPRRDSQLERYRAAVNVKPLSLKRSISK